MSVTLQSCSNSTSAVWLAAQIEWTARAHVGCNAGRGSNVHDRYRSLPSRADAQAGKQLR
eukprot:361858-Chlamydomonas_euryale.AAC.3